MKKRIAIAASIGLISFLVCLHYQYNFDRQGGDFFWAIRAERDLLAGRDPYNYPVSAMAIPYPLTAALPGFFFAGLSYNTGGALFMGLSSALLAFGLLRQEPTRLLVFLAYLYWSALTTVQWTPLLMCAYLYPTLLALTACKPQIGIPIFLTSLSERGFLVNLRQLVGLVETTDLRIRRSRIGLIITVAMGVLTLLLMPTWPWHWLSQIDSYGGFIPLFTLPGLLLLAALRRYRDREAQLLLLMALIPQRSFYDVFTLWLIPRSARELLITAALSWVCYQLWFLLPELGRTWIVGCCYLPMLALVLMHRGYTPPPQLIPAPQPFGQEA